jgi:hypothetical protein
MVLCGICAKQPETDTKRKISIEKCFIRIIVIVKVKV